VGSEPTHLSASRYVHGAWTDKFVCIVIIRPFSPEFKPPAVGQTLALRWQIFILALKMPRIAAENLSNANVPGRVDHKMAFLRLCVVEAPISLEAAGLGPSR
jgi:hypothetical protein